MFSGITGNVLILGLVSFFTDVSSEMIYPLLPLFLTTVLHAGPAFLGVIEGVAESTASLLKLISGIVSDRVRDRKKLVLSGYGLSSCVRPLIAVATGPLAVLLVRFADRIGILHGRIRAHLAASTGVYDAQGALKQLLAGAQVVQLASTLVKNGIPHLGRMLAGIDDWLDRKGTTLDEARGSLSQRAVQDPGAFERAQYVHLILSQNI